MQALVFKKKNYLEILYTPLFDLNKENFKKIIYSEFFSGLKLKL